jgi:[acyl-carrier-protein] S-malonyltransferase
MTITNSSTAVVFPGQGSQAVGMLGDLAEVYPQIRQTFDEASEALGRDLWELAANGPVEELNNTQNTQPAVLTAGVAMWRVLQQQLPITPAFMAGHSLGEYTALVCSGSLKFIDAVKLVEQRASFMQQAVPEGIGSMAAILGLELDQLATICDTAAEGEVVSPVNINAPGQIVIAGHLTAVNRAIEAAKEAGAKRAMPLPVSVPSHCALMNPAAEALAKVMEAIDIAAPEIPVLHNTDVQSHKDPIDIKEALAKQLFTPVRWIETVEGFSNSGVSTVIECGPGKILSGLNKRIDKSLSILSTGDVRSFDKTLEAL